MLRAVAANRGETRKSTQIERKIGRSIYLLTHIIVKYRVCSVTLLCCIPACFKPLLFGPEYNVNRSSFSITTRKTLYYVFFTIPRRVILSFTHAFKNIILRLRWFFYNEKPLARIKRSKFQHQLNTYFHYKQNHVVLNISDKSL